MSKSRMEPGTKGVLKSASNNYHGGEQWAGSMVHLDGLVHTCVMGDAVDECDGDTCTYLPAVCVCLFLDCV